jgi:hypothetical protein
MAAILATSRPPGLRGVSSQPIKKPRNESSSRGRFRSTGAFMEIVVVQATPFRPKLLLFLYSLAVSNVFIPLASRVPNLKISKARVSRG